MIASAAPLLFTLAAIAVLGWTGNLFSPAPAAIAGQLAAVVLAVWARSSFQPGKFRVSAAPAGTSLITHGPYRFVRHPMYLAMLIFVWTAVASHLVPFTLGIGVVLTIVAVARVVVEERLLLSNNPEYVDYSKATKSLIPFLF